MDAFKNFAISDVSTGYDDAATSIDLAAGFGAKFPAAPFNATWWNSTDYPNPSDDPDVEIVRVTAKSTDTLTITRAQESTAASVKNVGGKTYKIFAGPTAFTMNKVMEGPASSTDNAILRVNGTTGKIGEDSGVVITDASYSGGAD